MEIKDIDSYLLTLPEDRREILGEVRQIIKQTVPEAQEVISYQMPAYKQKGIVVYFAAFKNHYSIFSRPAYLQAFKDELKNYSTTKSAVHIPYDSPIPVELITRITAYSAECNMKNAKKKQI